MKKYFKLIIITIILLSVFNPVAKSAFANDHIEKRNHNGTITPYYIGTIRITASLSISVVSAASLRSMGMTPCPTKPGGTCSGCQPGTWGLYCTNVWDNGQYKPAVVGNFGTGCDLIDYWDCPDNYCHCAAQGWPDHCCADWGDC